MTFSITGLARPLALTAAAATLALVGCSAPAQQPATPSVPSSATSQSAPTTSSTPSSDPSASATAGAEGNEALLAAAALAAEEVPDGTVVSVEAERDGWEVHVVTADGGEQQLRIDAAGTQVLAGPTDDRPDADDRAENEQFAQVEVDYAGAVRAIEAEIPGGRIGELSLDTENRRVVWEADVTDGAQQRSVQVDAGSGDVISNRLDD